MKDIGIEEFHEYIQQQIISDSQTRNIERQQAFFEHVNEELIENGELTPNYTYAYWGNKLGVEINGIGYDETRQILSLSVNHYVEEDAVGSLSKSLIDTKFKRLHGFLAIALGKKYTDIPKNEVFEIAQEIDNYVNAGMVSKIRFFLLSNARATRNLTTIDNAIINDIPIEFRVIDINYQYQYYLLENSGGDISIDTEIPSIEIDSNNEEYSSYLGVLSGNQIVSIYEEHGQKLFEQNVRTFLQFRTKVNQDIKKTILNSPERFFAYNNGITATASEIEVKDNKITHIRGLQIVNGGQTTSSIYQSYKKDKFDVSKIFVQLKISVIKNKEKHGGFVSKVSQYANTQNKINATDFFSNSPFHREFKELSKRILAPAIGGGQRKTGWYYERVRGEFANDTAYLSPAKKRQFREDWPNKQKLDKTKIAKTELTWLKKPSIVSLGPAKFFKEFASEVTKQIEKDNLSITEDYFKQVISRYIMYNSIERIIRTSDWYQVGGYRGAGTVYAMSYFSEIVGNTGMFFDFSKIWELQSLPFKVEEILKQIAKEVYPYIANPPSTGNSNPSEWAKDIKCWERIVDKVNIKIPKDANYLVSNEIVQTIKKEEKVKKRLDEGIMIQSFVVDRKNRHIWKPLTDYYLNDKELSPMKIDILKKFSEGLMPLPSEKQSKIIYDLYMDAADFGWEPEK